MTLVMQQLLLGGILETPGIGGSNKKRFISNSRGIFLVVFGPCTPERMEKPRYWLVFTAEGGWAVREHQ